MQFLGHVNYVVSSKLGRPWHVQLYATVVVVPVGGVDDGIVAEYPTVSPFFVVLGIGSLSRDELTASSLDLLD
jgi:hypothetical protein